jgi:ribosome-associated toxin RatA of RatAB toxin-antitoxin module
MGSMFDAIFRTFAGAFEARADKIYGTGGGAAAPAPQ